MWNFRVGEISVVWGSETCLKGCVWFSDEKRQSENMRQKVYILLVEIVPKVVRVGCNPAQQFTRCVTLGMIPGLNFFIVRRQLTIKSSS